MACRTVMTVTALCVFDKTLPVKASSLALIAEGLVVTSAEPAVVGIAGSGAPY